MMNQNKEKNMIFVSIILSLLLHIGLYFLPMKWAREKKKDDMIKVVRIDPKEIPNKQIIDDEGEPKNKEAPDDTRFLSKHNRKVDRETKARETGPTQNQELTMKPINPQDQNSKPKIPNKEAMMLALKKPDAQRHAEMKKPEEQL